MDALVYARGPIVYRLSAENGGSVVAKSDATNLLHEYACWCAEQILPLCGPAEPAARAVLAAKRRWILGWATTEEVEATRRELWRAAGDQGRPHIGDPAIAAGRANPWYAASMAAHTSSWAIGMLTEGTSEWLAAWNMMGNELERRLLVLTNNSRMDSKTTPERMSA